jgi:hypothetical protein
MMKSCTRCGQTKPLEEFAIRYNGRRDIYCYECRKWYSKESNRKRNKGKGVGRVNKWFQKPGWKPTPLYMATPRKPFKEWTDAERRRWRAALEAKRT